VETGRKSTALLGPTEVLTTTGAVSPKIRLPGTVVRMAVSLQLTTDAAVPAKVT
jgi:hypothetical protein